MLVIGSEAPWVEATLLAAGAARITTLEYGKIPTDHPQLYPILPDDMRAMYLNGALSLFDAVVTISSLEHSGMGRYGDNLNPWGDVQAMARAWCVSRPNAP